MMIPSATLVSGGNGSSDKYGNDVKSGLKETWMTMQELFVKRMLSFISESRRTSAKRDPVQSRPRSSAWGAQHA